jgi:hypothetical protein
MMFPRRSILAGVASLCALAGTLAILPAPAVAEECPNAAFRTGPSSHLPDCRAYELVSPAYKATGSVGESNSLYMSPGGTSDLLFATAAFDGAEGFENLAFVGEAYATERTASGWSAVSEELPASGYQPFLHSGLYSWTGTDLDGQTNVYMARGVGQADNRVDFFERRPDRSIVDVGPGLPPTAPAGGTSEIASPVDLAAVGVSADASRLVFDLSGDFWPGDGTEEGTSEGGEYRAVTHSLYEYLGTGNTTPLLVGVDDSGRQISQCGTVLGAGDPTGSSDNGLINSNHNAMSMDGNTVFFTAACGERTGNELYARIDNGEAGAHTVDISEPSKEDCGACDTEAGALTGDAHFEGASEDGSKVFFSTTQPLLGGDSSRNIYEYDFDAPAGQRIVRVSGGDATVSDPTAEVIPTVYGEPGSAGPPEISEDGSHVYFVAHGVLTRTPNGLGESAQPGAENLYVFERDAEYPGGRTAFIAQLSESDVALWGAGGSVRNTGGGGADVTPDGRFLVFTSDRDLTPDDTSGADQVFEYDAQSGALARVSIGQDGFNHDGNVPAGGPAAQIVSPDYEFSYRASAYWSSLSISADGSYVFFQSPVALTPQALNEVNGAENIYEYHAGRVSLISDGQDATGDVRLEGTDESGDDVFFTTSDRLVAQDTDTNLDVYDARIDGGFPSVAPSSCVGEACQGPLSGAPVLLSPGSEFQAGGNPPLTGSTPAAAPKAKAKVKKKVKRKRRKRSKRAAVSGHVHRKAGRS